MCHKFNAVEKLKEAIKSIRLDVRAYDTLTKEFLIYMCNLQDSREGDDEQANLAKKQL